IYKTNPTSRWSLDDDVVTDIYLDDNDILWVGTQNGGVNKADTRSKPFISYTNIAQNSSFIVANVVRAICEDPSGNLWIGTESKGITKIDRKNTKFTYYLNNPVNKNSLINNDIRQIYCDRFGYLWFGTKGGLDRFDPRTDRFYHYAENSPNQIPNNWVFWIMEDHSGYLWIGTFNGIAKYNRQKDYFLAYNPASTVTNKNVRVIMEDRNKKLWVATEGGGITRLTRDSSAGFNEKLTLEHFTYSATNTNSLINNQVLAFMEDENGDFWIGTNGGLCRFNQYNNTFTRFSVKTGLPDDLIMGILTDGKGHIWFSHKKGITRMDTKTFALRNFDSHDGLQGNEFSQNAYFRNKATGEMFFGGINGFNSFFPDSIKDNPFPPKIAFTGLQVSNQPVEINQKINGRIILQKSILLTKKIVLTYWDKNFSVEFAALHYSNPKGNRYKYKLEGFDNSWIQTDASRRTVTYSDLPSGTYYLKVYASNCDGLWNPDPAVLEISILPPWWLAWWAFTFYFILFGIVIFFTYKYIKSKIIFRNQLMLERLKAEKEKELNQMKLQFFTNISHEFRTPLSLIIDPLERLISDKPSPSKTQSYYTLMYKNSRRLLNLINQLLDFRKIESGNLQLKISVHDIVAFIKNIAAAFEFHATQRNIQFTFHSDIKSLQLGFDPDKLDKILYNLISNAFKYTADGGEIAIELTIIETSPDENGNTEFVEIKVKDNGIGVSGESREKIFNAFYQVEENNENKAKGTGIGLALTKELVELHKGRISMESETGKGSTFTVLIPVLSYTESNEQLEGETSHKIDHLTDDPVSTYMPADMSLQDESLAGMPQQDAIPMNEENHRPLILIVEDNDDVRAYVRDNLVAEYLVAEARNGEEGLKKSEDLIPDLIISDIMMPGMSGIELCGKLKTDERTSHVPIILLTARQSDENKIEGYETGADAYITKPFNTTILLARIKNLIESRQKLRELFSKGSALEIKKISINATDETFLGKVLKLIEENMEETGFDTDALVDKLNMSRSQLYRKIKGLTNLTVHDFITTFRMNKAVELLLNEDLTISEIAYRVGYSLPTNFTRSFVKQFGETPSKYIQSLKKGN
ncbi:MAG TPA: two-component regulator propeller domain-containing protein, partial [Bacteroidales bacterium]